MNDRRTKLLALVAAVAVGAFALDGAFTAFWWKPWQEVTGQLSQVEKEIREKEHLLAGRAASEREWKLIRGRLDAPREPDVQNHFYSHLDDLCDRVGATPDIQGGAPQRRGDFQEYVYDLKFRLKWEQFVDLLKQLNDSREFLKPVRLSLASQYDREDRMDLDLKISTIEYSPVAAKAGTR